MKKILIALLSLSLAACSTKKSTSSATPQPSPVFPAAPEAKGDPYEITKNGLTVLFNPETGLITRISNDEQTILFDGVLIDVGLRDDYVFSQAGFTNIGKLETWALPRVIVRKRPLPGYVVTKIEQSPNGLNVTLYTDGVFITYYYTFERDYLGVSCSVTVIDETPQEISGVAFLTRGIKLNKKTLFYEFPGNTPYGQRSLSGEFNYTVSQTDYCAALTCFDDGINAVNVIYINEFEKWGTGVYPDEDGNACVAHIAGVLALPQPNEPLPVGKLFIQLTGTNGKYASAVDLYRRLGYYAPEQNPLSAGVMYSAHPSGTMDTGFAHRKTLAQFADYLSALKAMGVKNVWLLPVFPHPGASVYDVIDHTSVDRRFGGIEGAVEYSRQAHALGMNVLYDYVPHGPRPREPLAVNNPDWISKKRDGTDQIEWGCVSFDYNNAEYAAYTTAFVREHASVWGVDGARIDCSMGGLPNWANTRASASGIGAGVNIVKAIREGFVQEGKKYLILPENFHPIPIYAPYTDIFYDMPLYRVMHNLNNQLKNDRISETKYVVELQQWLYAQRAASLTSVKQRFLGNHDTVSWTFDKARPQVVYGTEKAKAMWALISFIDGAPMIYQGDENPRAYGLKGEDLTGFFTKLFTARAEYIGAFDDIKYEYLDKPVFAFKRSGSGGGKYILINFSAEKQEIEVKGIKGVLFSEKARVQNQTVILEGFGFLMLRM
jgi:hypothetical protein